MAEEPIIGGEADANALLLETAKLRTLLTAYLPEGTSIDNELRFVVGLSVGENGIEGQADYRPAIATPSAEQTEAETVAEEPEAPKAQTEADAPRRYVPPPPRPSAPEQPATAEPTELSVMESLREIASLPGKAVA